MMFGEACQYKHEENMQEEKRVLGATLQSTEHKLADARVAMAELETE